VIFEGMNLDVQHSLIEPLRWKESSMTDLQSDLQSEERLQWKESRTGPGRPISKHDAANTKRRERRQTKRQNPDVIFPLGRPRSATSRESQRKTERITEEKYVTSVRTMWAMADPDAYEATKTVVQFHMGQRAFPKFAKEHKQMEMHVKLHQNSKSLLRDKKALPKKYRNIVMEKLTNDMDVVEASIATGFQQRKVLAIFNKQPSAKPWFLC
jgi:hypothetical protein